jgi:hypothetical protein
MDLGVSALSEKMPILRKLNRAAHTSVLQVAGDGQILHAAHAKPIFTDRDVSRCWYECCDTNFRVL